MKLYIKEFCKNLNSNDDCYYSSIGGYQYAYSTCVLPEITLNIESYSIAPTPRVLKAVWIKD